MLKLVIFDCDGVMFDSRETNKIYYNDLLAAFGLPAMTESELDYVHMHNVTDSVTYIFRHQPEPIIEEVNRHRQDLDYTPYLNHMRMEPDLIDFLDYARSRGLGLAISTNRTTTMVPLLETFQLQEYFEKIITAADIGNPKPAPDALFEILQHFHVEAAEAIYIGDSVIDRQHSAAAGVELIAFRNQELDAEYHVECFADIPDLPPFL